MYRLTNYVLFAACLFFFGCGGNNQDQADDMSDFAGDSSFQEQHDEPRDIAFEGRGEIISIPVANADAGRAYAIMSEAETEKYLFVIHEWWGLNDYIKQETERLAGELGDVHVIALDLYDGKVATTQEQAGEFMQAVSEDRARAIIQGAITMAGDEADIGTIGWCFGGGWSLKASIMAGGQGEACVMYYGMPVTEAKQLAPIEAPILAVFAEQDGWITPEVKNNFEKLADATNTELTTASFDANHAFANPTQESYLEDAAQEANAMALNFLKEHLME
jgi:carboxymethylenebutenolidase